MRRRTRASNDSISSGTSRAPWAPVMLAGSGAVAFCVSGGTFTGVSEGAGDDSGPGAVVSGGGDGAGALAGEVAIVSGGGGDPSVEAGPCSWARATTAVTQLIRVRAHARFIAFPPPMQLGPLHRSAAGRVPNSTPCSAS